MVKNPSADAEDVEDGGVRSLGWEESLEESMATHPSILACRIPWTETWWATVHMIAKSQT